MSSMAIFFKGGSVGASLYVDDLHSDVTASQLFDPFSKFNNLASIQVCRDSSTGRSSVTAMSFHFFPRRYALIWPRKTLSFDLSEYLKNKRKQIISSWTWPTQPTRSTRFKTGSTRVKPEPIEKPVDWARVGGDGLQLGLGSTRAWFYFSRIEPR